MKEIIIKTAHEESYVGCRSLGVLINYKIFEGTNIIKKYNSLIYVYDNEKDDSDNGMYTFFKTIVDMNDYLLYGNRKVERAYMHETNFDYYYDNGLDIPFEEILKWTS